MRFALLASVVAMCSLPMPVGAQVAEETATEKTPPAADGEPISYYAQIRPIFQRHCQGCHQPAKASGGYQMTEFDKLLAGGESDVAAITPGDPLESYLLDLISPDADGIAEMPKNRPPLSEGEVALVRRWIESGAQDDTPPSARIRFTQENPPTYALPPIITALAYSPGGEVLAVAGHHEVLLHQADGSGQLARLVGMSQRIESLAFSPDGKQLAVTGGLPGRMGEVQIWDVAKSELVYSVPVTFDTVYGASWSPDGTLLGFGCSDTSLRAIEVATGKQVLFQGAHDDWVLDTVFSVDGKHLVSASRDMTLKLIVVETERFVDNITSITPGALKGGIHAVDRHPTRDELIVGGADGVPKTYRMHREVKRVIGDDSNLIRRYPAMEGRIFDVAYNPDGTMFAAASSLDGRGQVALFAVIDDTSIPEEIKKIQEKTVMGRSGEEKQKLEEFHAQGAVRVRELGGQAGSVYAVAFSPDGTTLASAGLDGKVRLHQVSDGALIRELVPVALSEPQPVAATQP